MLSLREKNNPCWDDVQQQSEMLRRIRIRWQQKRWPRETPFERLAMLDFVTNNLVLNERRSPSNWRLLFAQDYLQAFFVFPFLSNPQVFRRSCLHLPTTMSATKGMQYFPTSVSTSLFSHISLRRCEESDETLISDQHKQTSCRQMLCNSRNPEMSQVSVYWLCWNISRPEGSG